jgi:DNA-binding MarR family transcriptional regulator
MPERLELSDYRRLAEFRHQIRRFLSFSEAAARAAGIEPQQHQLLLALKGLPVGRRPNIGALADRLCVKHHTAVALIDNLVERRLVLRQPSEVDGREVLVVLTRTGEAILRKLSALHRRQLKTVGAELVQALQAIIDDSGS